MLKKERRNNAGRPIAGSLLSMKFVDNVLTVLGQCFDLAVLERPALLEINPAKEIRLPKHDRREMFFLNDAAAYAALRGAMNAHFHALLDFLVGTGARYGEAAGLWVQHLHLDAERPYVDIRAALKWRGKKRTRGRPKTRSSIRRILLPPRLVEALRPLVAGKGPEDFVFTMIEGGPLHHGNFARKQRSGLSPSTGRSGEPRGPGDERRRRGLPSPVNARPPRRRTVRVPAELRGPLNRAARGSMSEAVEPHVITAPSATTTPTDIPTQQDGPVPGRGYDLKAVLRDAGRHDAPPPPTGHRQVVRMRGSAPADTSTAVPVDVAGFADGIQADLVVCYVEHRPVTLVWVAAGAVGAGGKLLYIRQRMALVASALEQPLLDRLHDLGRGLPVHPLEELTPWGVATATKLLVDGWRREVEHDVVANTGIPEDTHLFVDGSIRSHPRDALVGVVKSVDETQYLTDESVLPVNAGRRSPVFELPATRTTERSVLSCYLRLHDTPGSTSWSHGLIRLEARDPDTLDGACAVAMRHRQFARSGDSRWATHLRGMRRTEETLRAFRSVVFRF
jgi:hypothetical protein